jgi:hypothetical protein
VCWRQAIFDRSVIQHRASIIFVISSGAAKWFARRTRFRILRCLQFFFLVVAASAWMTSAITTNGNNSEAVSRRFLVIVLLLAQCEAPRVRS